MKKLLSGFLVLALTFSMTACKKDMGGESKLEIPGVDGPNLALVNDQMIISMVFENLSVEGGLRYPVPKYPNSYIEVSPDFQSEGTLMAVTVDLDDLFGDVVNQLDPQALPGGRPIPGVASGTLPSVAFSIPQWNNMGIYLGPSVFGLFVPVNLDMNGAMISAKFYADGTRQGNIYLIGEDENDDNSGFLLLLNLDSSTKKKLKYLANKY